MPVQTDRTRTLTNIAGMMPVANRDVADGLQQSRLMGVQQAVAAAPTPGVAGGIGTGAAGIQASAAKATAAGGAVNDQVQKTSQQTAFELGRGAEAEQGAANTQKLTALKAASAARQTKNEATLASLGAQAKAQVYDASMKFQRDQNQQLILNDQQLADWAITKAQSAEQLKNRQQQVQQASDRMIQIAQTAANKLDQELQIETQKAVQDRNAATAQQLAQAKAAADKEVAKQKANAANRQAEWTAGGVAVGAVVGGVVAGVFSFGIGTPGGAAVGGMIGGAVGSGLGAATSGNPYLGG